MKTLFLAALLLIPLRLCAETDDAQGDILVAIQDSKDDYRVIMYDATPAGPTDSSVAKFALFKGEPKTLVGSYYTLGETLGNIGDPTSLSDIELAWGRNFLRRFHSLPEAEAGIASLEKSAGPRDLGLRLVRQALPSMTWTEK